MDKIYGLKSKKYLLSDALPKKLLTSVLDNAQIIVNWEDYPRAHRVCSDHNGIKSKNSKDIWKFPNFGKLNHILTTHSLVKVEVSRECIKYFKLHKYEHITYQIFLDREMQLKNVHRKSYKWCKCLYWKIRKASNSKLPS